MNRKLSIILIISKIMLVSVNIATSQDSHYWTQHYGTQSTLLAGTAIGSFQDISAVYYNPGAIAQMDNPAFLLSARAFDLTWMVFKNGAGDDYDLDDLRLRPSPDILAGVIPTNWEKNHRLAYFYITRQFFRLHTLNRYNEEKNIFRDTPADDQYSAESAIHVDMREDWFGLTWSYKYNTPVSVGISHYFAYRSHDMRLQTIAQAISSEQRMATTTIIKDFEYYNVRLLWKGGIAVNLSPLTLGLSLTTPSISLFGNGSIFSDKSSNGLTDPGNSDPLVKYDVYSEFDNPAYYKTGWAAGIGASYKIHRSTLHFSAEWYEGIPAYKIMDAKPYTPASDPVINDLDIIQARTPVLNFGLGYEHKLNKNINGYGGITTDFSALPENSTDNTTISHWNLYHINSGVLLQFSRLMLNLGIGYAFGNGHKEQIINFNNAHEDNYLLGELSEQKVYYNKLKFVLGFSFHFFTKQKESSLK